MCKSNHAAIQLKLIQCCISVTSQQQGKKINLKILEATNQVRILFKCVSKKYIVFNTLSVSKIDQNLLEMLNKKLIYQNANLRQIVS